ncbi:MAG: hypothetical protein EPN86_05260 [Nanoarchaeota archaeon]|nr:MAG: hypothetical protein EPN86_05260 [Nanoarchaeota archaeon]
MPKKEKIQESHGGGLLDILKSGMSMLPELFFSSVFNRLRAEADVLADKIERRLARLESRFISLLMSASFFITAALFLALALLFFLIDSLKMPRSIAFLAMGTVMLLAAIAARYVPAKLGG